MPRTKFNELTTDGAQIFYPQRITDSSLVGSVRFTELKPRLATQKFQIDYIRLENIFIKAPIELLKKKFARIGLSLANTV